MPSLKNFVRKIIIIGFGSIGQRHHQNLLHLGFQDVYVYDIDEAKIKDLRLKIKDIGIGNLKHFNVALICNPNYLHIRTAIQCAKAGWHLFIEKPLSHNLRGVKELINICQEKKLVNMVACNMRFHPCIKFIKNYLDKKKLGKIYSINLEFGYYLPYWRPGQDYKKNYAARRETGGGIILDDIHEFDLLFWLNNFEEVKEANFVFDKVSDLEIETEDICLATFKFKNNVLGSVNCDYLQRPYSRNCKVIGEKGNLEWDFNENVVWLKNEKGRKKLFEVKNYQLNNMYLDEIKYFFNCVQKHQKSFNDIEIAAGVLKYCLMQENTI